MNSTVEVNKWWWGSHIQVFNSYVYSPYWLQDSNKVNDLLHTEWPTFVKSKAVFYIFGLYEKQDKLALYYDVEYYYNWQSLVHQS